MPRERTVEVKQNDLDFLISAFDAVLSGNIEQLRAWFLDSGNTEEEFDAALKRLGTAIGRDCGIL